MQYRVYLRDNTTADIVDADDYEVDGRIVMFWNNDDSEDDGMVAIYPLNAIKKVKVVR